MLDQYKIKTRIEEIRQTVKSLERDFKHLPEEKLITDQIIYRAAERNLEIAIQCIIDISNHIISQLGLERPRKENKEIFLILAKEKIIPMEFAKKIMTMVGYRNKRFIDKVSLSPEELSNFDSGIPFRIIFRIF